MQTMKAVHTEFGLHAFANQRVHMIVWVELLPANRAN
jgi:hypothetical protein